MLASVASSEATRRGPEPPITVCAQPATLARHVEVSQGIDGDGLQPRRGEELPPEPEQVVRAPPPAVRRGREPPTHLLVGRPSGSPRTRAASWPPEQHPQGDAAAHASPICTANARRRGADS